MKPTLLAVILLLSNAIFSQSTNRVTDFFSHLDNQGYYKIKRVEQKKKTIDTFDIDMAFNIDTLKRYLTVTDKEYLKSQLSTINDTLWNKAELKQFRLLDSKAIRRISKRELKRNRFFPKRSYYYSFSHPLFSRNGEFALIQKDFYCGIMCADYCLTIYRKDPTTGIWKEFISVLCASS